MDRYISKLTEIQKFLLMPSEPGSYFQRSTFIMYSDRVIAIVDKKYGQGNIYEKKITELKSGTWIGVNKYDLENLIGVIDLIIDDLELDEKKEDKLSAQLPAKVVSLDFELPAKNNKVFIVHGHNETMKQTVARVVQKLQLEPIILHEKTNSGQTIIEKFLTNADVGFAIVLLSADDMGYSIRQGPDHIKRRSRQNVIFELGFFTAKLGRNRVIGLVEDVGDYELPSDLHGVIYIRFDGPEGKWRFEVARELIESGHSINVHNII